MVGVPALTLCDSGPSSRTTCPICLSCSVRMNQGANKKHKAIAVSVARMARKGR